MTPGVREHETDLVRASNDIVAVVGERETTAPTTPHRSSHRYPIAESCAAIAAPPVIDVRDYLETIAAVATEGAQSQDPEVLRLALKVLARQATRFATLSEDRA